MVKLAETVENLGNKIIRCREKCTGVRNDQENGYYPRAFFLEPGDAQEIKVAIIGKNPGNATCLEREFYKAMAERNADNIATYKDCLRIWRSISEDAAYFRRPRHLLKEIGLEASGILWAEIVFCEKSNPIPKETFRKCRLRYLEKIAGLLQKGTYVICLGGRAYEHIKGLPESDMWKIIGIYHPTGSRVFANYFEKEKGKKVTERKLKKEFCEEFRKLEEKYKSYTCRFLQEKRNGKVKIKVKIEKPIE